MLFFSEIRKKRVYTEDNVFVGFVDDLVFRYTETPYITKILVSPIRQLSREKLFIPLDYFIKINNKLVVNKNYGNVPLGENELFVLRNLMDKQIIDIQGRKVVRVNDVVLQNRNGNKYYIIGVDTGFLGMLRRFGLEKIIENAASFFGVHLVSSILSWSNIQPLELARGKVVLNLQQEKLSKLHPADLADYLEVTNLKNTLKIINLLDREFATRVIAELNLNYQISLLKRLGVEKTAKILSLMDSDEAVDVLTEFSPKRREAIWPYLDPKKRQELEELMKFSETSVGQFLTSEYFTVFSEDHAGYVIDKIHRETADMTFLPYVYVVNKNNQLMGVFNLHELILQRAETPVYKFMVQNINVVHLNTSLNTVLRKLIKYELFALPVVDKNKNMLGIVTIDDIGEVFLPNHFINI